MTPQGFPMSAEDETLPTIIYNDVEYKRKSIRFPSCAVGIHYPSMYRFEIAIMTRFSCVVVWRITSTQFRDLLVEWQGDLLILLHLCKELRKKMAPYRYIYGLVRNSHYNTRQACVAAVKGGLKRVLSDSNYIVFKGE